MIFKYICRSIRERYISVIISILIVVFLGCGESAEKKDNRSSQGGTVQPSLQWSSNPGHALDSRTLTPSASGDVCVDYDIETISVAVTDAAGEQVASERWDCAAHGGRLDGLKAGSGYDIAVDGIIADETVWKGETLDITIIKDQITLVETVMSYVGQELPDPMIVSVYPPVNADDVVTNASVTANFNNRMVVASILSEGAFTLSAAGVAVDGVVEYDEISRVTTFTPSGELTTDTLYTAIISSAEDKSGNSMAAEYAWRFTTGSGADTVAPSVPDLLEATAVSDTQIDLLWEAASDNLDVTHYNIYRDGAFVTSVTTISTTDTALSANTQYCYQVTANDAAGNESGLSNEICAQTQLYPPPPAPTLSSPGSGDQLDNNCDDGSEGLSWTFDWTDVDGATMYHIYVIGPNSNDPRISIVVPASAYDYSDSNGFIADANRQNWIWRVRAGNDDGQWSEWTEERYFDVEPVNTDCPLAQIYESENLDYSNTDEIGLQDDSNASNGQWIKLRSDGPGDYISFTVEVPAGTYRVYSKAKTYKTRGKFQLIIDGHNQGDEIDQYASTTSFVQFDHGIITFDSSEDKEFRFECTGTNSSSLGYDGSFDAIVLLEE